MTLNNNEFNRENYKGFLVQTCYDNGIIRMNNKGEEITCEGYYCTLHPVDHPDIQIDDFCLAVGYEITDLSDEALDSGIKKYIDYRGNFNIFYDCTESEIKSMIMEYVQEAINLADMGDDITIKGIKLYGSRTRNDYLPGSDLDVLIEYEGDYKEYMMFNLLNDTEDPVILSGILVDINPIRAEESGTIDEYYSRVCNYKKREAYYEIKSPLEKIIKSAENRVSSEQKSKEYTEREI